MDKFVDKKDRSWIALIFFCTATTVLTALVLAIVFASASVVYAVAQSSEPAPLLEVSVPAQTFSGMITDDHCGAKHQLTDKSPADCTRICVTRGAKYVLVDGDKVYGLRGDIVQLNQLAGERVTVVGSLHGNTIDFTSLSAGS